MVNGLEALIQRIAKDQQLFHDVEEVIRQGAILPILHQLGWEVWNTHEVSPEFKVSGGRVDYCLRVASKKTVFIEVKRPTEELDRHEEQLLKYSFADGVELAVLTNGFVWWFYLPLDTGKWQQRKFFTIDIRQQSPDIASAHFVDFLGRTAIADGSARTKARQIKAGSDKEELINQTIPKAWEYLLSGPDELLIELFADTVEGMCGHKPELEQLADYLKAHKPVSSTVSGKPATRRNQVSTHTPSKPTERTPRKKGVKIQINGTEIEASFVSDLYHQVLKFLCDNKYIDLIKPSLPYATSSVRYLISEEPYHQRGNEFRTPVEYQGYFMEAHKAYAAALKHLEGLLGLAGLSMQYTLE